MTAESARTVVVVLVARIEPRLVLLRRRHSSRFEGVEGWGRVGRVMLGTHGGDGGVRDGA